MAFDPKKERYHPAPYKLVDFPEKKCTSEKPASHAFAHSERYNGLLRGKFVAVTYIRIGTGSYELGDRSGYSLYQPMFKVNGIPTIPGSTLKGAIRSIVEAITCPCLTISKSTHEDFPSCAGRSEENDGQLCIACRLFGSQDYQGAIHFRDAQAEDPQLAYVALPALWRPRPETPNLYYHNNNKNMPKGRKFYKHAYIELGTMPSEVCVPNTEFKTAVSFSGLRADEIGLLLLALGQPESAKKKGLILKMGSNKPSGCGSLRFELESLEVSQGTQRWQQTQWDTASATTAVSTDKINEFVSACCNNKEWFAPEQYEQLRLILCPKRDELRLGGYEAKQWAQRHKKRP